MNAQNAHKYLPLVQALVDGKTLQYRDGFGNWGDTGGIYRPYFEADHTSYRVKPEPRTFDVWINKKTKKVIVVEDGDSDKDEIFFEWERITVREVLK